MRGAITYLYSLAAVVLVVLMLVPFVDRISPTTVALALLLTVLIIAVIYGSRRALLASILSALCFNFFFLPPYYTFHIADTENWVAFGAFVVTALVAGQLSTKARKRADESERRRLEIERLYKELKDAFEQASEAEALRRSEKLKSALLDAITHDLRTPLTSIKASATTLLESKKTTNHLGRDGEIECLQIINEESDRLNQFIEGLVGLAQIEANAQHLRKIWTTIREIINPALDKAKQKVDFHEVVVDIETELPSIYVDASSVSEAIYLLIDNAAKYSPPGSTIKIAAMRDGNSRVEIFVDDQGIGIPLGSRERIFQKFVRVADSRIPSTADGMGLGLAIAKGIVESQGGTIWIDDAPAQFNTRFAVTLPINEA